MASAGMQNPDLVAQAGHPPRAAASPVPVILAGLAPLWSTCAPSASNTDPVSVVQA